MNNLSEFRTLGETDQSTIEPRYGGETVSTTHANNLFFRLLPAENIVEIPSIIEPESSGPLSWLGLDPGVLEGYNNGRRDFRSTEALTWLGLDPGISQAFIASAWLSGSSGPLSWLSLDPGIYYLSL